MIHLSAEVTLFFGVYLLISFSTSHSSSSCNLWLDRLSYRQSILRPHGVSWPQNTYQNISSNAFISHPFFYTLDLGWSQKIVFLRCGWLSSIVSASSSSFFMMPQDNNKQANIINWWMWILNWWWFQLSQWTTDANSIDYQRLFKTTSLVRKFKFWIRNVQDYLKCQ